MKHLRISLPLIALIVASFCMSCANSNSNNSPNVNAAVSPTPKASPTPPPPGSGNLVEASASGDISYRLSGAGDAAKMNVSVKNKTERVWELKIEVGTKLEPSEGNVQQMVVTKEYEVHLEPHEEETLEIEVSCLDISKDAPATDNKSWGIKTSKQLADFLNCANAAIDELVKKGQADNEDRHGLLQFAIWKARGATRDDFIHLIVTYSKTPITEEEAGASVDRDEPLIIEVMRGCPSLVNLS